MTRIGFPMAHPLQGNKETALNVEVEHLQLRYKQSLRKEFVTTRGSAFAWYGGGWRCLQEQLQWRSSKNVTSITAAVAVVKAECGLLYRALNRGDQWQRFANVCSASIARCDAECCWNAPTRRQRSP